jgi:hypothetical protein
MRSPDTPSGRAGYYLVNRLGGQHLRPGRKHHALSNIDVRCPVCGHLSTYWYDRLPADIEPHQSTTHILCRQTRCDSHLYVYVSPEWLAWAELWRPYQRVIDGVWGPGDGPEPRSPTQPRPAPVVGLVAERTMSARHGYYLLTCRAELAAAILRTRTGTDPQLWPGAEVEFADLYVFAPEDPHMLASLLSAFPDLAAAHAIEPITPGEALELSNVRKGLEADRWWPASLSQEMSAAHLALSAAAQLPDETPPAPLADPIPLSDDEPDIDPDSMDDDDYSPYVDATDENGHWLTEGEEHSAEVSAWLDEHWTAPVEAEEVADFADLPTFTIEE